MAFEPFDDFDETTWPDAGPLKTGFIGTAAVFADLPVPLNEPHEDFNLNEGWIDFAAFSDDPGVEGMEESKAWNLPSWGNDAITPDVNLSFDPVLFDPGGNLSEEFETVNFGVILPNLLGVNSFIKISTVTLFAGGGVTGLSVGDTVLLGAHLFSNTGFIVSITQPGVSWSQVVINSSGGSTRCAIWKGFVTGAPSSTVTVQVNAVNVQGFFWASKWKSIINAAALVSSAGASSQAGAAKTASNLTVAQKALFFGIGATTSNVSWSGNDGFLIAGSANFLGHGTVITHQPNIFVPTQQVSRVDHSPSAFGSACFAAFGVV